MKMWVSTNPSNKTAITLYTKIRDRLDQCSDEVSFTYYLPYKKENGDTPVFCLTEI